MRMKVEVDMAYLKTLFYLSQSAHRELKNCCGGSCLWSSSNNGKHQETQKHASIRREFCAPEGANLVVCHQYWA
jgi:hypothetical protein